MAEETKESAFTPSPFAGFRKALYIFAVLFLVWVVMGQIIPKFVMKIPSAPEKPIVVSAASVPPPTAIPVTAAPDTTAHAVKVPDEQITDMQNQIVQLKTKLQAFDDWQQHPPATVDNNRIAHLEDTVAKQGAMITAMQSQLSQAESRATFAALNDEIEHGEPFDTALQRITMLTQGQVKTQEALARLTPFAADGIATVSLLQIQFESLLPKALDSNADSSSIMHNLESLVRIRKVGEQQGSDDEAVLARAEAAIGRGDVKATLKEMAALSPKSKAVFEPWNQHALTYVAAHDALFALQLALAAPAS